MMRKRKAESSKKASPQQKRKALLDLAAPGKGTKVKGGLRGVAYHCVGRGLR